MDFLAIQQLLQKSIEAQANDATSEIGKAISERALKLVENATEKRPCAEPLNVSFVCTAEQQAVLRSHFPGREVRFSNKSSSSHSFAAAHRLLETDFIYGCFNDRNSPILDLGGNYVSHFKRGRFNVHSCCPLLDGRDGARHTERMLQYDAYKRANPRILEEADFCNCRFEDCSHMANYAMAIHATSDMPLDVLCRTLARKGVKKFICSIMATPEMVCFEKGEIEHFNVAWEVDKNADRIFFDFIDAPCLGYDHKYSTLLQYLTVNAVKGKNWAYRVERKNDMNGVIIVDITFISGFNDKTDVSAGRSCAWMNKLKSMTLVRIAGLPKSLYGGEYQLITRRGVLINTKVLTRVIEAAFRNFKPDTPMQNAVQSIATMLSSSTNHVVVNGVSIVAGTPLQMRDYIPLAVAIYVYIKRGYDAIPTLFERTGHAMTKNIFASQSVLAKVVDAFISEKSNLRMAVSDAEYLYSGEFSNKKEKDALYEKTEMWVKNSFFSLLKTTFCQELDHELGILSSPDLFIPLDRVLEDEFEIPTVLTVEEEFAGLQKKREADEKAMRVQLDKDRAEKLKLDKAILSIAAYIDKAGDKAPIGIAKLIPDIAKLSKPEQVFEEPDAIINPYADSISEAIEYIESTEVIIEDKLKLAGNSCDWSRRGMNCCFVGDDSRRVFLRNSNAWVGPPHIPNAAPTEKYEVAMTKDGWVFLEWEAEGFVLTEKCKRTLPDFILVNKDCVFQSGRRIIPALKQALKKDARFKVKILDGVAGCGKSYQIANSVDLSDVNRDLVLTSNRNASIELREVIKASPLMKAKYVRTCDSYLMASRPEKARRLLFDECFMRHAGFVYAAATLAECEEVLAYGDTEQIPEISRNPAFKFRCHKLEGEIIQQTVTYRCPADAVYVLNKHFYKTKRNIKTKRHNPMRSLNIHAINSVRAVPVDKSALYLTYTQAEKEQLKSAFPGVKVLTVHEAEGASVPKVILVRLSRTSLSLYTGKDAVFGASHALVAISRHTHCFEYYNYAATDQDDIIWKACRDALTCSDETLLSFCC